MRKTFLWKLSSCYKTFLNMNLPCRNRGYIIICHLYVKIHKINVKLDWFTRMTKVALLVNRKGFCNFQIISMFLWRSREMQKQYSRWNLHSLSVLVLVLRQEDYRRDICFSLLLWLSHSSRHNVWMS